MININNSVKSVFFGNNISVKKQNYKTDSENTFAKPNKTSQIEEQADAFVTSNKNPQESATEKTTKKSFLNRRLVKMDSNKVYKQVNKNLNPNEMGESLKSRIIAFPFVLKGIMALIPTYLSQKIDADTFSQVYLERTPHLFTRLDYGNDKEAFAKDFESEIKMVKNVNVLCDDYQKGNVEQSNLDATIEENLEEYLQTPENKDVFYLE